jgi:hypothetical protein
MALDQVFQQPLDCFVTTCDTCKMASVELTLPVLHIRVCFFLLSRPSSTCSLYEKSRSLEMLSSTACRSSSLILPSSEGMSVRASSAVSQQSVPVQSYNQHDYIPTFVHGCPSSPRFCIIFCATYPVVPSQTRPAVSKSPPR